MYCLFKRILPYGLGLLFLFGTLPTFGQINESDSAAFQFSSGATGFLQTGNVRFFSLRGRLEVLVNGNKPLVFKSQNQTLYQEFGGFKADNDLLSRNFLYLNPRKRFYPFAIAFVQTNFRRKLNLRYFFGAGYTYQFIRSPRSNLKFSLAGFYEETAFEGMTFSEAAYNGQSNIALFRATAYLNAWHSLAEHRMRVSYSAFVQPSLDGVANTRFQANIALQVRLLKGLSFRTQYRYQYEQVVVEGIQKVDGIFTLGLDYQFQR